MVIICADYHPSDQYIAFVDTEIGESGERRLNHSDGEAERFYRELAARGVSVRVGMEATGYSRWFERLLAELGIELLDRRCGGDQGQASPQAEDRPQRCSIIVEAAAGKYLSSDLGTESRESGSTATALAPAPAGADAHADHESAAGFGDERRPATEEEAVERTGTSRDGKTSARSLGSPAPAGSAGVAGRDESDHRGVNRSRRAGSEETARGAAADDTS